ncbi:hypothetical protein C8A03DRAFT_33258 [Achaetomium macrosporum]|uniref:HypA-like protein n=1 Tax=Achaetomium macrosporum TaxID=79813 RepID=A0AAN7HCR1_9PEZI|nr:hypothetical protein C8A03DRAFT_33258 [Achaetomium macrosporum]
MASLADLPYKMHVTPDNTGLWRIKQTDEAAKKASELLQEDMENHHVFFNNEGFHNHISHHLLALYGTGAGPSHLTQAYHNNATYQRPALPPHTQPAPLNFRPFPAAAKPYFDREEYYPDFLRFFQEEIRNLGSWQAVVGRYVLGIGEGVEKGEEEPMLTRLFAGFLHPLIQLMYGVEWGQEAIVAEGLAQAAVHSGNIGAYLLGAEKAARERQQEEGARIVDLLEEVKRHGKLAVAARMEDANKIRDGVLARAGEEMIEIAAKVRVRPDEVEERTAEMFNAALFVATAAALVKEGKRPKIDFFLMHHVNASPIFVTLNAQDWIPTETKARLMEWKIRMDLLEYAARGVPELSVEKLASYQPKKPDAGGSLPEIIARLHTFPDDGHAIKLGRATGVCHNICKKYEDEGKDWLKVKGEDMWKRVSHLIVDSVEAPGPNWVRSCGFDEAWKDIPDA